MSIPAEFADSMPLAPENDYFPVTLRQVLFKTRRGLTYRLLFVVQKDYSVVVSVRGPGQDLVKLDDLGLQDQ